MVFALGGGVALVVAGASFSSFQPRETAIVLVLGIYLPPWLDSALHTAARFVEMQS